MHAQDIDRIIRGLSPAMRTILSAIAAGHPVGAPKDQRTIEALLKRRLIRADLTNYHRGGFVRYALTQTGRLVSEDQSLSQDDNSVVSEPTEDTIGAPSSLNDASGNADATTERERQWWSGEATLCDCGEPLDASMPTCPACRKGVDSARFRIESATIGVVREDCSLDDAAHYLGASVHESHVRTLARDGVRMDSAVRLRECRETATEILAALTPGQTYRDGTMTYTRLNTSTDDVREIGHATADGTPLADPPIYDSATIILGGSTSGDPADAWQGELREDETIRETVERCYGDTYGAFTLNAIADLISQRLADESSADETITRHCVACDRPIIVHRDSDAAYGDTLRCDDGQGCDIEPEDTSEDPSTDHGFDVCPDCGNGGIVIGASGYEPCARFLTCWADPDETMAPHADCGLCQSGVTDAHHPESIGDASDDRPHGIGALPSYAIGDRVIIAAGRLSGKVGNVIAVSDRSARGSLYDVQCGEIIGQYVSADLKRASDDDASDVAYCACPDDCGCRNAYRATMCGCKGHTPDGERISLPTDDYPCDYCRGLSHRASASCPRCKGVSLQQLRADDAPSFQLTDDMIRGARDMGVLAAKCAATWTCDGNTKVEGIRWALKLAEEGDPRLDECLPAWPNLSGEWADDLTSEDLARDIIGEDVFESLDLDTRWQILDTLSQAWEDGVSETFEDACIAELQAFLPDTEG